MSNVLNLGIPNLIDIVKNYCITHKSCVWIHAGSQWLRVLIVWRIVPRCRVCVSLKLHRQYQVVYCGIWCFNTQENQKWLNNTYVISRRLANTGRIYQFHQYQQYTCFETRLTNIKSLFEFPIRFSILLFIKLSACFLLMLLYKFFVGFSIFV